TAHRGTDPMTKNDPGPEFWTALLPHTGKVSEVCHTERGNDAHVTAVVDCAAGSFFVKAVRNVGGGRLESILLERLINPYVAGLSPAVRWYVDSGDWYVLGYQAAEGRHADLTPGSADLPELVRTLDRLSEVPCP